MAAHPLWCKRCGHAFNAQGAGVGVEIEGSGYCAFCLAEVRAEQAETAGWIEQLAAIEHERWADWQRYMHSKGQPHKDGWIFRDEDIDRWNRQINTPYAELTEREKESDREQVRRYLHLVRKATD